MSKKEGFFRGILDSLQDGVYFVVSSIASRMASIL
jgi:hypothetical protein